MTEAASALTLTQVQEAVDAWIQKVGIRYFAPMSNLAQLVEEVGEVARVMVRTYGDQSHKPSDRQVDLGEELGDVLFVLVCIANQTGVDLNVAFLRTLQKNTDRDTERHRANTKLRE